MSSMTRLGLTLMGLAVALGILGDVLLRPLPLGVNLAVWMVCFAATIVAVARWQQRPLGATSGLLAAALVFAALPAWRASPVLLGLDLLAVLVVLGLMPAGVSLTRLATAGLSGYAANLTRAGTYLGTGPVLGAVYSIAWPEVRAASRLEAALPAVRGTMLAVPLVMVFAVLFSSADANFDQMIVGLFDWNVREVVAHIVITSIGAYLAAGALGYLLVAQDVSVPTDGVRHMMTLSIVEIGMALAALDVLFLIFVVVQAPYLFGGALTIERLETLSYAEYARRGFFELVTAAALVLPLLITADWSLHRTRRRDRITFRLLAGGLVGLVFIVMASAVQRMMLYQSEYGLTELRVYTTAFMGWLAVLFLLFLGTVWRGAPRPFAAAALGSGLLAIVALHILNPDDLIARTNVIRPNFDALYASSLSADAVPALLASLPHLAEAERTVVAGCLHHRWGQPDGPDWRTWNLARATGRQLALANAEQLPNLDAAGWTLAGVGKAACTTGKLPYQRAGERTPQR